MPLGFLALAGLAVWWLVSGERPSGSPGTVVRRAALGVGLLIGCFALAVASFFASGLGGGVVVAAIVIAAGAGLVAAAFVGGARWLVLPALAIALPLAFVSAAGIDLDGGFGERHERPATLAELADELPARRRRARPRPARAQAAGRRSSAVGRHRRRPCGRARAPTTSASPARPRSGWAPSSVFDRDSGGIDVDWNDARRAPAGTARLVLDGDVGLGLLEVRHNYDGTRHSGPPWERDTRDARNGNNAPARSAA